MNDPVPVQNLAKLIYGRQVAAAAEIRGILAAGNLSKA